MLIVIKTERSDIDGATIGQILKQLEGVVDVKALDAYDEKKFCVSAKIPVYPIEALIKKNKK